MGDHRVVVFAGPSLPPRQRELRWSVEWRPPAMAGDVIRAVRSGARTIILIDGSFETVPAVKHKEILWALSKGVQVVGASSMGAIRAVELQSWGMVGIGKIFEDFLVGTFEGDDEVAVYHGPQETGFVTVGLANVNVHYTLQRALHVGRISATEEQTLYTISSGLHYKERSWSTITNLATQCEIGADVLKSFQEWVSQNFVDQKYLDAVSAVTETIFKMPKRPRASLGDWGKTHYLQKLLQRAKS